MMNPDAIERKLCVDNQGAVSSTGQALANGSIDLLAKNAHDQLSNHSSQGALALLMQGKNDSAVGVKDEGNTLHPVKGEDGSGTKSPDQTEEDAEDEDSKTQEATFPQQLMDAVEQETVHGTSTCADGKRVLEWLPTGDAFVIRDKGRFEREVLPKYFVTKCKVMSFVRKLYRWGFRQVEKNLHGGMIFMHVHFIRGERKRCLMMRSTVKVKKPSVEQPHGLPGFSGQLPANNNGLQAFGGWNNQLMNGNDIMRQSLAAQYPQQVQNMQMYHGLNQGGNGGLMNPNGAGPGGPSSLFMPNQHFNNQGSLGMTPAGMFQAGLHQKQQLQQMQHSSMHQNNTMHDASSSMLHNSNAPAQSTSVPPPASMAKDNNTSHFSGGGSNLTDDPELKLASEIMRCDPNIEPWKALELAKRFNNK